MTSFAFILGCVPLWTASGLGRGRPPAYRPCSRMPEVDVVAICSPGQFHAAQVEAATAAGKRGILCEKPLATTVEEAQLIADVSARTGVPVVVGAMHVYDPAFAAAQKSWGDLPDTATLVPVAVYLPQNDDLVNLATELAAPAPAPGSPRPRLAEGPCRNGARRSAGSGNPYSSDRAALRAHGAGGAGRRVRPALGISIDFPQRG